MSDLNGIIIKSSGEKEQFILNSELVWNFAVFFFVGISNNLQNKKTKFSGFDRFKNKTDGRTDGQTDKQTIELLFSYQFVN